MRKQRLDEIDVRILDVLQREGRIPNMALAERVGLSSAPCFRRVKALERSRIIRRYAALVDPAALGLNVTVLVSVSLDRHVPDRVQAFEHAIRERPEVMDCWVISGSSDFLMRVVVEDVEGYEAFQRNVLSAIPGVVSINSSFALKQVKGQTEFPIAGARPGPQRSYGLVDRAATTRHPAPVNSAPSAVAAAVRVRRAG